MLRRDFLTQLGAAALVPSAGRAASADLILLRANVITMDAARPRARAIAIAGDRRLAVGDEAEVPGLARPGARRVDLAGRTVVPGFIDAHSHPGYAGREHLRSVDCDLRSIMAIQTAIRERASKTPPEQWVLGFKYDDTKTVEGRFLTRDDLDVAAPDRPVFISHRGGHTAFVNSRALERAGISDTAPPDPPGGRIERAPGSGRATGRLLEAATDLVQRLIPENRSRQDYQDGVKLISRMLVKTGITSVHDAFGAPEDLRAYQDAHQSGDLLVRVYCFLGHPFLDRMLAAGVRTGLGNERVRVGGIKAVCDGSISERTARLSQPYVGRPSDFGILVTEEPALYDIARRAHEAGWQIGIHANGDVAVDLVLRIYERLQRELPRTDPRFRIEHCTVI